MAFSFSPALQIDDYLQSICEKLQITPTMHSLAEQRYRAVADWLNAEGSRLAIFRPAIYPQGSLRIGTTVRPLVRKEFDLDFVCQLDLDWRRFRNPVYLLDLLEDRICSHKLYRSMCERKNRCMRISYADEFYMDILPACPDTEAGGTCLLVPDCAAKDWKASNPRGYARWFESKTQIITDATKHYVEPIPEQEDANEKAVLKLAVQLLKRRRDVMFANDCDNAPISIVLTTLAAQHYRHEGSVNMALMGILDGILTSISQVPYGGRLVVLNPSNLDEDLSERWDNNREAWRAFVEYVTTFHQQWQRLNQQRGIDVTAALLEQLFGEEPVKTVVREKALAMQAKRDAGQLAITRSSGLLV
ncbi:MAG TPA: nucleotidyltransferase, partial [Nitrososphaera sp.]|nr:nucleotidyltransferase [Nitrososphaera sp.]